MLKLNLARRTAFAHPPIHIRRGTLFVLASTLILGAACDVHSRPDTRAPDAQHFEPLPATESPEMPPGGRISLEDALSYAESHAPDIVVARGQLAFGRAEIQAAKQAQPYNPTVSVGLGQRRQAGGAGLDAQVAIEQQLEVAGQRRKRRAAAERARELTELGLDAASWEVHAEVHRSFQRALLALEALTLSERLVAFDQETLDMVRRRVELGDESPIAVEVASAQLAMAENRSTTARAEVELSRLGLARAIGWDFPQPPQPEGKLEPAGTTPEREVLVRRAFESSPLLKQAEGRTQLARAQADTARREAWPSPTVGISYAREGSTSTPGNPSPASDVWMGSLAVPLPTFARNQGSVARSEAQAESAAASRSALFVQFGAMVGSAVTRVDAAAERVERLERDVVPGFERSLVALQRAYEVGELDFLELSPTRTRLAELRLAVLDARADYYDAFAELERLVGPLPAAELNPEESTR